MLIAMPVYDTVENGRSELTKLVIPRLLETIGDDVRIVVFNNNSCEETKEFLYQIKDKRVFRIHSDKNLGIAGAVNVAWKEFAEPDEIVCKMDNDCFIISNEWTDTVKRVFNDNPEIGILGLKRKDLAESPNAPEPHYRSRIYYSKHVPGDRWIPIEEVNHVMGTCYCFNPKMREKFGYLMQPGTLYGFDDALSAVRAHKLGYKTCFLPHVEIDHLDVNTSTSGIYTKLKQDIASDAMSVYHKVVNEIMTGKRSAYSDWKD